MKATVTDKGAGVKNWQYAVIDGDKDMTSTDLEALIYPDSGESQIKWTEGTNGAEITVYEGEISSDNPVLENRIVLISATDNVGNSVIYASNGVVIENYLPVITIKDLKAGYGMTDSIDFYLSVTDAVASDTENKVVSGISSITCTWEFTDMEGNLIAGAEGQASWTDELVEQPLTIQLPEGEAREDCKVLTLHNTGHGQGRQYADCKSEDHRRPDRTHLAVDESAGAGSLCTGSQLRGKHQGEIFCLRKCSPHYLP